jgi:hypothetical protein
MKKSRYELVQRPGSPPLVRRRHYPRYVFEVMPGGAFDFKGTAYDVTVVEDTDGAGPAPETYLRDVAREWHYLDNELKAPGPEQESVNIFELLNGAYVARECFGKSRAWFYQRLNGNIVNGEPARFTDDQKRLLSAYLRVKAREIEQAANALEA